MHVQPASRYGTWAVNVYRGEPPLYPKTKTRDAEALLLRPPELTQPARVHPRGAPIIQGSAYLKEEAMKQNLAATWSHANANALFRVATNANTFLDEVYVVEWT